MNEGGSRVLISSPAAQVSSFLAGSDRQRVTIPEYFLAGMITGFTVAFIEGPIDLVRIQIYIKDTVWKRIFLLFIVQIKNASSSDSSGTRTSFRLP